MGLRITGEVVKVFELEADSNPESGYAALRFRIELIADHEKPHRIMARIWRKDFYRLQPTFPQERSQPKLEECDELVFVEETSIVDSEAVAAKDWKTVLDRVVEKMTERLVVQ